jgi:hypothetical protein
MNLFISHRCDDTELVVGRIYDRLAVHFDKSSMFVDVDSILPGIDIRQALTEAVGKCDVVLALLGDRWLSVTDEDGKRRLENEDDYLRFEIELAMRRDIPVIPVLVGDVTMPSPEELPSSLRDFAFRNATRVSIGPDFERDLTCLIRSLESHRSMAVVECVNCCERVIPMADGACPACRRHALQVADTEQAAREGSRQAMIRIREGARLPLICCTCATPTERLVKIHRSRTMGGESLFVRLLLLTSPVFWSVNQPNVRDVTVRLPQCRECSRKKRLEPIYVDFERATMKVLVHREFRRQCEELS